MEPLDGNAIGGLLHEVFGAEMTTVKAVCAHCGDVAQMAELVVYLEAPGTVVRCRNCGNVVIVILAAKGVNCVDLRGLAALDL
jgi:hypothetical protein